MTGRRGRRAATRPRGPSSAVVAVALLFCAEESARAEGATATQRDLAPLIPVGAYAYSAGTDSGLLGAQVEAVAVGGRKRTIGGGMTGWWAPIDRLTLFADAQRDVFGHFAPSLAAITRVAGEPNDGWSLGLLGKFKVEGFGIGPNHETESEIEAGAVVSYAAGRVHLDLDGITGAGLGDDGEIDAEARVRFGGDITRAVRLGLDGQARWRVTGTTALAAGRTWDFAGGPQLVVIPGRWFVALTAGPSTMNVPDGRVAFTSAVAVGAF